MNKLKLTSIGKEAGIVLSEEMMKYLDVQSGDTLFAIQTGEGYILTSSSLQEAEQLQNAEEIMKQREDSLKKLAE